MINTTWVQRGRTIEGDEANDFSGFSVDHSSNGLIVAIGAIKNDGNGEDSGQVRVFEWKNSDWVQNGDDIDGLSAHDESGFAISLTCQQLAGH